MRSKEKTMAVTNFLMKRWKSANPNHSKEYTFTSYYGNFTVLVVAATITEARELIRANYGTITSRWLHLVKPA